jgi:hypothetical protein
MSKTLFEQTRDGIYTIISGVRDIGVWHKSERHVESWAQWFGLFKDDRGLTKTGWFFKGSHTDQTNKGIGDEDVEGFINHTQMDETWRLYFHYGFHDDDNEPSQAEFDLCCERLEQTFRFNQDIGGVAFQSAPLQRTNSGLWLFPGGVLCHRAEFSLVVTHRIQNPN